MVSSIYNKLTPYTNSKHTIVHDQQVSDIISAMLDAHVKYAPEYNKIAPYFAGRDAKTTARNIYNFLKNNVNYVVEDDDNQMIKSPSAILYTGRSTGSDCKNYSLFGAGVLDALNRMGFPINWTYRFASYKMFDKMPHHVFVVINPDTNNEIWLDPVLNGFDYKKQYYYKLDKKPKNMSLIALSGIGAKKKASPKKVAKKKAKAVKKTVRTAKRKEAIKKVANKIKSAGKAYVKLAATPIRNAFLILVKTNYKGLATGLNKMYKTNPDKLKTFWESQKGTWSNLIKNIETGSAAGNVLQGIGRLDLKRKIVKLNNSNFAKYVPQLAIAKAIHKKHIENKTKLNGIGLGPIPDPSTIIDAGKKAVIITASPILLKAVKFLKDNGINLGADVEIEAQDQVNKIANNAVQDVVNEAKQITAEERQQASQDESDAGITPTEETASTGMGKNTLLLVGAGAVGLYLLTKKR